MPPAPEIQMFLDQLAEAGQPPLGEQSLAQAREGLEGIGLLSLPVEVDSVVDRTIPGPEGDLAVRIYRPASADSTGPVLVWFHGGGWVLGSLDSTDGACRALADRAGMVVVSVDYRLAPEHPAPAAVADALAAVDWVRANAADLDVDGSRVAVGGDSAGGNLAAVVAQQRDVQFQLLVYPVVSCLLEHPSIDENGEGYLLTKDSMEFFVRNYLSGGVDPHEPQVSPLFGPVEGVAPAHVVTAEFDPLRDEGQAYAARLQEAGVDCTLDHVEGQIHAFFQLSAITTAAVDATERAAARLREVLS